MSTPSDCMFSESHEWYRIEGDLVTVGITQYAANELTDITYVEMQPAGTLVQAGGSVGEVESVKTTSDIYCPFAGEITEVNEAPAADPATLNRDPYQGGWLIRVRVNDLAPRDGLLDQVTYDQRYPVE